MSDIQSNLSHQELSGIAEHFVNLKVSMMQELVNEWKDFSSDPVHWADEIKENFAHLVDIWKKLAPARKVARMMFPELGSLFDMLDRAVAFEEEVSSLVKNSAQ